MKTKAVLSIKFFSLASVFAGVVILSLCRMILLTKEAVPTTLRQEQFIVTLVNLPDDNGLRGKQVLGRMWDTSAANSEDLSASLDSSRSKQNFKEGENRYKSSSSRNGPVSSDSRSVTKKTTKKGERVLPFRLQMHFPPLGSLKVEPKFNFAYQNLHTSSSTFRNNTKPDSPPRTVMLDPSVTRVSR